MKYRIVSNGETFRVMVKESFFSRWKYIKDTFVFTQPLIFTTIEGAEAEIKDHMTAYLKLNRKWNVIKEYDISKLEIALNE